MERYRFSNEEQTVLERLPQPLGVYQFIDRKVITIALSDGFCELFGYADRMQAYDDMDNDMYKHDHPEDVARIVEAAQRFATEGGEYDVVYRTRNRSGDGYRILHAKGKHVYTQTGERLAYVWYTDEGADMEEITAYGEAEQSEEAVRRRYVLENIDRAIENGWIKVFYQPIIRTVNGRVCDEESLARWDDPELGLLTPADFIPFLEDAGQIYKLDLYVVEQVLKKILLERDAGLNVVPHSVNLSRADFDACDIVEEIRHRVDASGVERAMINIEITESIVGGDFEFMKEQVRRFRELGFPVWMDDFGSGYSSLDLLQSIRFDLLKFDMSFMRKLDEGDDGKIILTELVKMATSLQINTICEGVESEAQARFLQEIGCSKLQGYYYCRPIPLEQILQRYEKGIQIGYENPEEVEYYEAVGRVNLYDLDVIASDNEGDGEFRNFFNTLPMGIIEVSGDAARFMRSNQSYRDFIKRFFGFNLSFEGSDYAKYGDAFMYSVVKVCCEQGIRSLYDEKMPDGSIVHSFARRIGINPVNGNVAVAAAVLSITSEDEGTTYANIARALAADYYNIYYVDMDTEKFIEYNSMVGGEELSMERHGEDFFAAARRDTMTRIHEDDREAFLKIFTKENINRELDENGVFMTSYRLIETGTPMYVNMKITRLSPNSNNIILGISIIDRTAET